MEHRSYRPMKSWIVSDFPILERYVLIRDRRARCRGRCSRVFRFRRPLIEVVAARDAARARLSTTAALATSAQQDDVIADDVGHVFLLTGLLVVPGIGSNAAFDIDFTALLQILS